MSITTITETEHRLTHMLNVCSEALKQANAERNELKSMPVEAQGIVLRKTMKALLKVTADRNALRADAERYRWLRTCENDYMVLVGDVHHCELLMEEQLDAAVDAAMEGKS